MMHREEEIQQSQMEASFLLFLTDEYVGGTPRLNVGDNESYKPYTVTATCDCDDCEGFNTVFPAEPLPSVVMALMDYCSRRSQYVELRKAQAAHHGKAH